MGAGHIFVSYNSVDKAFADELVQALESDGLRIWYAPRDVRPGIDYSEQIQKAVETATAFVVVVSEAANRSKFVRAETEMAFSNNRPIFPVRTSAVRPAAGLALFLQLSHWTDVFGPARRRAVRRLTDELLAMAQGQPAGSRGGPTLFRPRLRRIAGDSAPGLAPRSYAPVILIAFSAGALILALILAFPGESQANLQAGDTVTADLPANAAAPGAAPAYGEPNYDLLRQNWMNYARETAPPPPEEYIDNSVDMGMDSNMATDVPDETSDVNGM